MNIGKYVLERMNDGRWIVYWTDLPTRYRNQVILDDLETIFDNLFQKPHDQKKLEMVTLFRLAFTNHELFFQHGMSHDIVKHLPNVDQIPGTLKTQQDRFNWHLNSFIEAYSSLTGIRFSPTEVEPMVIDLKEQF